MSDQNRNDLEPTSTDLGSSEIDPIDLTDSDLEPTVIEDPAPSRKRKQPAPTKNAMKAFDAPVCRGSRRTRLKCAHFHLYEYFPHELAMIIINYAVYYPYHA